MDKVILISIDGVRPDGLLSCGNPYVQELLKSSTYTLDAQTVYPSNTLPSHTSIFNSQIPQHHGTLTNAAVVPTEEKTGLFEHLKAAGASNAMVYGWAPMRNLAQNGRSLMAIEFFRSRLVEHADDLLTDKALELLRRFHPDFLFHYMPDTDDDGGHAAGWMSETYLDCIRRAIDNVKRIIDEFGEEYTVLVVTDHGGHDHDHGTDLPEDMTVPMILHGRQFAAGKELHGVSTLDIAPTVAAIMGVAPHPLWEGKSLL